MFKGPPTGFKSVSLSKSILGPASKHLTMMNTKGPFGLQVGLSHQLKTQSKPSKQTGPKIKC